MITHQEYGPSFPLKISLLLRFLIASLAEERDPQMGSKTIDTDPVINHEARLRQILRPLMILIKCDRHGRFWCKPSN